MKIGVDMDGVIYPFHDVMRDYLSEKLNREFPYPTQWDLAKDWNLSEADWNREFTAAIDAGVVFTKGQPIEGAKKVLGKLQNDGHTIHIVTDRLVSFEAQKRTVAWLAKHGIQYDSLTFARTKTLLPVDVFIEDAPHHIEDLHRQRTRVVVFDQPWNRKLMIGVWTDLSRAMDWDQVLDSIEHFADVDQKASASAMMRAAKQTHERMMKVREARADREAEAAKTPTSLRAGVLGEALDLIEGDRNSTYGEPHEDFQRTAHLWTILFGRPFKAHEVAMAMTALKLSRLTWSPMKRDSWVDIAGYAGCGLEAYERTR